MQILHRGIFMPAFDRILQLARMEEMDCEFVEVTAHEVPALPMRCGRAGFTIAGALWCRTVSGTRILKLLPVTAPGRACAAGTAATTLPVLSRISVRNYTDERLAELDARNIPYGGGLYTRYEITQMQRVLERRVRGQQLLVEVDNADNGENVE